MFKLIKAKYEAAVAKARRSTAQDSAVAARLNYVGSYTNAERKRTRAGMPTRKGTRDQHLDRSTLEKLGKEAADVLRNNPEGRAIIGRLADLLVQKGFDIAVNSGDKEFDTAAERIWRKWAREKYADSRRGLTHFQQARDLIVNAMTGGGMIVIPLRDGSNQLVSIDRLATALPENTNIPSERFYGGVELNDYGAPQAFWIKQGTYGQGKAVRVPAGATSDVARMFRCPKMLGAEQTFGEPGIQAVIERLETLDSIIFNSALCLEVASVYPLVVESPFPDQMKTAMEAAGNEGDQPTNAESDDPRELQIEPGRAIFLPQGAKASQVKAEHPSTGFDKMVWTMIALAGADLGLPLVVLSLDFSQVNFHGGRVAMGMAELALHSWREELASTFIRPSYRQLISAAIRDGRLPFVEGWDEIDIVWPPMPIVDLKAEYEASELGIRNNLTTLDRETRRLGTGQWEEIVAQKGREAEAQKAAGVMPALLPGATDLNAKPEDDSEPDEDAEPDEDDTETA